MRPRVAFLAVALLALVPALLLGRKHHTSLPRYGEVPAFALVDEAARPFSSVQLRGNVWLADFIFTGCAEACPRLTERMRELDRSFTNRAVPVQLVSFSVDPQNDTPARLTGYARSVQADPRRWHFLTGPAQAIEKAVVDGFHQGLDRDKRGDDFSIVHGTKIVLVDRSGEIRGYYDANDAASMQALAVDTQHLAESGE